MHGTFISYQLVLLECFLGERETDAAPSSQLFAQATKEVQLYFGIVKTKIEQRRR